MKELAHQGRGGSAPLPNWRGGIAAAAATKSPGVPEKTVRLVYDQADGAVPDTRRSTSWTASAWAAVTSGASYAQGWLRRAFLALRKGFAGSRAASADAAEKEAELVWTVEDVRVVELARRAWIHAIWG